MGRGRVQLKLIENKINRQVTFSKRKVGLLKKAHEISVLCDARVAMIVFSSKGKLVEYSTDSCMEKILERYERYSNAEGHLTVHDPESPENWPMDSTRLKEKIELLQQNHQHYMGEDLDSLSQKELQNLEQQIDTSLKHIRSRKNKLMHASVSELQRKIKEKEKTIAQQAQWEQQNHAPNSSSFPLPEPLPYLGVGGIYQGQEPEMRNELELTLQPIYPCNFGYIDAQRNNSA